MSFSNAVGNVGHTNTNRTSGMSSHRGLTEAIVTSKVTVSHVLTSLNGLVELFHGRYEFDQPSCSLKALEHDPTKCPSQVQVSTAVLHPQVSLDPAALAPMQSPKQVFVVPVPDIDVDEELAHADIFPPFHWPKHDSIMTLENNSVANSVQNVPNNVNFASGLCGSNNPNTPNGLNGLNAPKAGSDLSNVSNVSNIMSFNHSSVSSNSINSTNLSNSSDLSVAPSGRQKAPKRRKNSFREPQFLVAKQHLERIAHGIPPDISMILLRPFEPCVVPVPAQVLSAPTSLIFPTELVYIHAVNKQIIRAWAHWCSTDVQDTVVKKDKATKQASLCQVEPFYAFNTLWHTIQPNVCLPNFLSGNTFDTLSPSASYIAGNQQNGKRNWFVWHQNAQRYLKFDNTCINPQTCQIINQIQKPESEHFAQIDRIKFSERRDLNILMDLYNIQSELLSSRQPPDQLTITIR